MAGAIIYFLPLTIPANQVIGLLAVFIGVLANASSSLLGRKVNTQIGLPAILITTISMGIGGIFLLIAGVTTQGFIQLDLHQWLIICLVSSGKYSDCLYYVEQIPTNTNSSRIQHY